MIKFLHSSPRCSRSHFSGRKPQHCQLKYAAWCRGSRWSRRQQESDLMTTVSPWALRLMPHWVSAQLQLSVSVSASLKGRNGLRVREKGCSTPEPELLRVSEMSNMLGDFQWCSWHQRNLECQRRRACCVFFPPFFYVQGPQIWQVGT